VLTCQELFHPIRCPVHLAARMSTRL